MKLQVVRLSLDTPSTPYGCCGRCTPGAGQCGKSGACDLLTIKMVASLFGFGVGTVRLWRATETPSLPKPEQSGHFRVDALLAWVQTRGQNYFAARHRGRAWWAALTREEKDEINDRRWNEIWGSGSPDAARRRRAASLRAVEHNKAHPEYLEKLIAHQKERRLVPPEHREAAARGVRAYYADPAARPLIDERNARAAQTRLANRIAHPKGLKKATLARHADGPVITTRMKNVTPKD